jgi:hypothetical protein
MRPKNPARDSPIIVPFGCANEECGRGRGVRVDVGAGIIKEGSELEEGKGIEVSDVPLYDDEGQHLRVCYNDLNSPLALTGDSN